MIGEKKATEFWQQFRQNYITEADIARIKELGFNGVRPAMNWRLFMDEETGKFKREGFQLIDNLVAWCKIHEVYIILDMHAAPGGQTGANIDDLDLDVLEELEFNMVRGFRLTGKNIRIKLQVKPGLIHNYKMITDKIAAM